MIQIGEHSLSNPVVLAPMAGITDLPFREVCQAYGAGAATAEMLTSDSQLWQSQKSSTRLPNPGWPEPRIVQIAGSQPEQMAEAARRCAEAGAQIVDINMGCPAKKVCKKAAGSALLQNESLVAQILNAVVQTSPVPVTLKIRTGWDQAHRNAPRIARIAEDAGIRALTIHGRTKACLFRGQAEYETIAEVVTGVAIPVFANGDIDSPEQAKAVIDYTGAAGVMIGRGAQGQPWLFGQINHLLNTGQYLASPEPEEVYACIYQHLGKIRAYYCAESALRLSRKHITPYLARLGYSRSIRKTFNLLNHPDRQDEFLKQCRVSQDLLLSEASQDSLRPNNKNWNQAA